jgi:hypothetical protein
MDSLISLREIPRKYLNTEHNTSLHIPPYALKAEFARSST